MKGVLLATTSLILLAAPVMAMADEAPASPPTIEVQATVSTSYLFERQADIETTNPVVNGSVTWHQSSDFSGNLWVQVGDEVGREVDLAENFNHAYANGLSVRAGAGLYLYPRGGKPSYTAYVGATLPPVAGFTVNVDAQQYEGRFRSTLLSVDVSHSLGPATLTLGHGFNWNEGGETLNPWYGRVSVPLGHSEHAPTIGIRGFWGAGSGIAADISYHF